jgi:hypothetical protein
VSYPLVARSYPFVLERSMRVVAMTSQKITAAMQRVESVLRRRPEVGLQTSNRAYRHLGDQMQAEHVKGSAGSGRRARQWWPDGGMIS